MSTADVDRVALDVDPDVELPQPDISTVQQLPAEPLLTVPVRAVAPVPVSVLPARCGAAFKEPLSTAFSRVLGADPKRRRTVLCGTEAWEYSRTGNSGSGVPWPADVPLILEHCDAVYARVPTSTGELAVIAEVWAE